MTMTTAIRQGKTVALATGLLLASAAACAQPDTQPDSPAPVAPTTPGNAAATSGPTPPMVTPTGTAADALKKQAGDVDQASLLKDTLSKTDRSYSLLRAGRIASNYDFNYSYTGNESMVVGYDSTTAQDQLRIQTTRAHTLTNTLSVDYGLLDNLTVSGSLPFVSKFTQSTKFSGTTYGLGDISFGARYQPFVQKAGGPTITLTSALSLPTGRSPYEQIIGQNTSTGNGFGMGTLGVNASQVFDPVALFGSLSVSAGRSVSNLHQFNDADRSVLTGLQPGKTIGFGAGFTYALSYNVSTSVSFQEGVTTASHITYTSAADGLSHSRGTTMQVSALLNFGLSVRVSPKTSFNLSAGMGLTTDSPDFSLGLNIPLTFALF
jgi:hypothetical protein